MLLIQPICQHLRRSGLSSKESSRWASRIQKVLDNNGADWTAAWLKGLEKYLHHRLENPGQAVPLPPGFASKANRKGERTFKDGLLAKLFGTTSDLTDPRLSHIRKMAGLFCKTVTIIKADVRDVAKLEEKLSSIVQPHQGIIKSLGQEACTSFVKEVIAVVSGGRYMTEGVRCMYRNFSNSTPKQRRKLQKRYPALRTELELNIQELMSEQENSRHFVERKLFAVRSLAVPLAKVPYSNTRSPSFILDKEGNLSMKTLPHTDLRSRSPFLLICSKDTPLALPEVSFSKSSLYQLYNSWTGDSYGLDVLLNQRLGRFKAPVAMLDLPVGKLSVLNKDGSAKRRIIAMPCLDLQTQLDPLKQALNCIIQHFRASGVHDQDQARLDIQRWLLKGEKLYAFDQSAFTDRFPYDLQRELLQTLKVNNLGVTNLDISLMDFAVHGKWYVPQLDRTVQYEVGQPMGLNPSFALATLSHLMVAYEAFRTSHGYSGGWQNYVRIVGDDIVIKGDRTGQAYLKIMTDLGVTINHDKSMVSNKVSNFCGRIITAEGCDPSLKVKMKDGSPSAVLNQIEVYGLRSYGFFRKTIEKFGDYFTTPKPIGMGFKPPKMTYASFIRQVDPNQLDWMSKNAKLIDLLGSPPTKSSVKKAICRSEALTRYWISIGFFGDAKSDSLESQADPVVRERAKQEYFGLTPEAIRLLSPQYTRSEYREVSKHPPYRPNLWDLLDHAARQSLTDPASKFAYESGLKLYEEINRYLDEEGVYNPLDYRVKRYFSIESSIQPDPDAQPSVSAMQKQRLVRLIINEPSFQELIPELKHRIPVAGQLLKQKEDHYVRTANHIIANSECRSRFFAEAISADRVTSVYREYLQRQRERETKREAQRQVQTKTTSRER